MSVGEALSTGATVEQVILVMLESTTLSYEELEQLIDYCVSILDRNN